MRLIDSTLFDVTYLELGDRATAHLIAENDVREDGWHVVQLARQAQWAAARKASSL